MIGPLLAAAASLAGIGMQAGAQSDANNINWMNLFETKRSNRKAESLARATRRDAYGNELEYIEGIGWVPKLTDITKKILSAEQGERYRNLSEDAPRNRAAAVRMDKRSQMADDEFEKVFNEYKFRPRRDESSYIADTTQELLSSRRKGLDEAAALLAKQLMRTGGSSQLASVFKQADDAYAGSLAETMLKGKTLGRDRYNADENADLSRRTGELGFLEGLASKTTTSPVEFSGFNQQMTGMGENALQGLIQAIRGSQGATSNAMGRLASSVGQSPDFGGLAAALGRLSLSANAGDNDESEEERLLKLIQMSYAGGRNPAWQTDLDTMRGYF
jgi:hypothetical protein